jgi:rhodanese-related sulfurtransferase
VHHEIVLVDLRSTRAYAQEHIEGAVHSQFDDFLKAVVVEAWLKYKHQRGIVLICDTGHMSGSPLISWWRTRDWDGSSACEGA